MEGDVRPHVWRSDAYPGWRVVVVRIGPRVVAMKPEQDGARSFEGEWDYCTIQPGQDIGSVARQYLARIVGHGHGKEVRDGS